MLHLYKISKLTILFVFLVAFSLKAQIIVDKNTLLPIPEVLISGGNQKLYSDHDGSFNSRIFTSGIIEFTHVAYLPLLIEAINMNSIDTVFLSPRIIETGEVIVTDKQRAALTTSKETDITISVTESEFYKSTSDIVNKNTALVIKDYGGYAGLKTAAARGLSSENTLVLFNEAKVNDIRTGSFDLSLVSPGAISRLTYTGLETDEYFGPSAGGVLKLFTGEKLPEHTLSFGGGIARYGAAKFDVNYFTGSDGFNFAFNANRSYGKNDYRYIFEGEKHNRSNSDYSSSFISGNLNYNSSLNTLKIYAHYSSMKNGLPGFITTNNFNSSRATNSTKSILLILNDHWLPTQKLLLNFNLNIHSQDIVFEDPTGRILSAGNIQSSKLGDIGFSIKSTYKFGEFSRLNAGYRGAFSKLKGLSGFTTAVAPPDELSRFEHNIYSGVSFFREITFPGVTFFKYSLLGAVTLIDETIHVETSKTVYSGNTGLAIGLNLPLQPLLLFHYSKDTRIPTFNERYYSGLYDISGLKNEEYEVFDAGIEADYTMLGEGNFSLTFFQITGKNKIIWIPYLSILQVPRNINEINNSGLEASISHKLYENSINLNLIYTYTRAKNITANQSDASYGKQLIYTPRHTFKGSIDIRTGELLVNFSLLYTGSRYYTADNDPFSKLEPHFITDLSIGYKLVTGEIDHNFTLNVYNLFNENYMVIQSYPMPLRTISLNYRIEIL